jgi:hypothetical protein
LKTSACFECGKRTSNARCKQLGVFEQRCNQALQGCVARMTGESADGKACCTEARCLEGIEKLGY